jgi:hypothetical protein
LARLSLLIQEWHDGRIHPLKGTVLRAVFDFPLPDAPRAIVLHRFRKNSGGWKPELMMRWSWPINSSREYLEIAQNLSLTKVIFP